MNLKNYMIFWWTMTAEMHDQIYANILLLHNLKGGQRVDNCNNS